MMRISRSGKKKSGKRKALDPGWADLKDRKLEDTEEFLRDRCEMIDIGKKEEKLIFKEENSPHVTAHHLTRFIDQEVKMPTGIKNGYWYNNETRLWHEAPESVLCTHAQAVLESVCAHRRLPFPWQKDSVMRSVWRHIVNCLLMSSKDFVVNTVHPHLCPVDFVKPDATIMRAVIDVSNGEIKERVREHYFSSSYDVVLTDDHILNALAFAEDPSEENMRELFPNCHRFFTCFFCEDFTQVCVLFI